jgi:hypothetical protein
VKRIFASLLLGFGIVLAGSAQPPSGDTQEPPVRLKKKKKAQPEQPPDKPERPEQQPEVKKKPKLREDGDLDPRDDLKLEGKQESEEDQILERITRNTRLSEEKLANREVGEPTRKLQEDVLKDLDRLIQKAQESQQNPQNDQNQQNQDNQQGGKDSKNDGSSAGSSSGQQGKPSQRSAQERAERKQRRSGRQTTQRSLGNRQGSDQPMQTAGQGNIPGGGGDEPKGRAGEKEPDKKTDLWGHLPEKERALMNKEMEQKFMEKYDDLTRQFYRTIAEKSRGKK